MFFTFNTDLRYIKIYNDEEAYFVSNMMLDLEVLNNFNAVSTADLNLDMNITSERILAGTEIYNLEFNFKMKNDNANIDLSAKAAAIFRKTCHRS